jgi:hypothetical protein
MEFQNTITIKNNDLNQAGGSFVHSNGSHNTKDFVILYHTIDTSCWGVDYDYFVDSAACILSPIRTINPHSNVPAIFVRLKYGIYSTYIHPDVLNERSI